MIPQMLMVLGATSALNTFTSRGQAKAQNILINAQNAADAAVTAANNQLLAANAGFQRVAQSLNNQRQLRAAGEAYNASSSNITRMVDDFSRGSMARQLQASEDMGAVAAQAAAAGTGGMTQELVARTAAFQVAVNEQAISRAQGLALYDAHSQRAAVMSSAVEGLDVSPVVETMNYLVPQRAKQLAPTYAQGAFNTLVSALGSKEGQQMLASWGSGTPTKTPTGASGVSSPHLGSGSSGLWSGNTGTAFKL